MKKNARRKAWLSALLILIVILGSYVLWTLKSPLPSLKPVQPVYTIHLSTMASNLSWPAVGESAVGILNSKIIESDSIQKPEPTASTAKLVTALTILQAKPLSLGQQGPLITLSSNDAALYAKYLAEDGSVVPVQAGEQITEYQMLEAMLLPSANNMADSLAIWGFGSLPSYKIAASAYLTTHGLNQTTIGDDASGFLPNTISTANNLVQIGELAMQNPVIAQIVGLSTASGIPVAGNIKNVNSLLGSNGIIGIKTGNTDQAGGVYISAAKISVNQKPITIITALMSAPTLSDALKFSLPLIQSSESNFNTSTVLKSGSTVGYYYSDTDEKLPIVTVGNLSVIAWNGSSLSSTLNLLPISSKTKVGQVINSLSFSDPVTDSAQSVPLKLAVAPDNPSTWYRLIHPNLR
jgi:D-alanyl-D-alanine carboxypeptidase (penicillin-binding protein 5/6)